MLAIIGGSGLTTLSNLDVSHREVVRTPYGEASGALGRSVRGFSEGAGALVPRAAPRPPPRPLDPSRPRPSVWNARKRRHRNYEAPVLPAGQTTMMVIGASPE